MGWRDRLRRRDRDDAAGDEPAAVPADDADGAEDAVAAVDTITSRRLTAEEAEDDPRRHMLRSAVVGEDLDLVDLSQSPWALQSEDVVVLASDGIHSIADIEIARIIAAYRKDGPGPTAEALLAAVRDANVPHQDNTTVVVVTVGA